MGLKCTLPKCGYVICALTGYQELLKLKKHFWRKHKVDLSMQEVMAARVEMEDGRVPARAVAAGVSGKNAGGPS